MSAASAAPGAAVAWQQPDTVAPEEGHGFDYDLIVLGGGSGGLACVKEAARYGKKCAVLDFVVPSPQGTSWGLGGTCVNVGCIPKKLFHHAALMREQQRDLQYYGWQMTEPVPHDWMQLVSNVNDYIKSLNWSYAKELRTAGAEYLNEFGAFVGPHTVECTDKDGKKTIRTARRFVIAVGGRPRFTGIPNERELCITSDDIFQLPRHPGKTLVIGASYIAVECGGFLRGLGCDVTMMVRSRILREFDQDMAARLAARLEQMGVRFLQPAVPTAYDREPDGRVRVTFTLDGADGHSEVFDTVLLAIGRNAVTPALHLERIGLATAPSGKLPVVHEQTAVPYVYALGDCIEGRLELTPVAIQAGVLLARRLYGGSHVLMDYDNVPTTVFGPVEYGCVGLSEEEAVRRYTADDIEVYHVQWQPLEWKLNYERYEEKCYAKLICVKSQKERVVGLHVLAPEAGEITQGFALGLKLGATKFDFDNLVGIHPTNAEQFTTMAVTKASGEDPDAGGC